MANPNTSHIGVFLPSLSGGGVASSLLRIVRRFLDDGHRVDLLAAKPKGEYLGNIPNKVRFYPLERSRKWRARLAALRLDPLRPGRWLMPVAFPLKVNGNLACLPHLIRYLHQERPEVLLSGPTYPNVTALMARQLSGAPTRIVVSEHSLLSMEIAGKSDKWQWKHVRPLISKLYPCADGVVAVSEGVKHDLARQGRITENRIDVVYNPVISDTVFELASYLPGHRWLENGKVPVVLAAGRLLSEKDWPTLLRALARVRERVGARLIILGEGEQRGYLERMAADLGIKDHVDMPGFVDNPYAYMARATVFALSSKYEGLGNVLVEALACGCPVVSTDCPSGPAEILQDGRFGRLVQVGDHEALAEALMESMQEKPDRDGLRARAWDFSVDRAYEGYRRIMLCPETG